MWNRARAKGATAAAAFFALGMATGVARAEDTRSSGRRPPKHPGAVPVLVTNDERTLMPVRHVGAVEVIAPMFRPRDLLIRFVELTADGPNGASVSLPAVQDWLIFEIALLPRPLTDPAIKAAVACDGSVRLPADDVHDETNLPAVMNASWSGTDFRSFNQPLAFGLRRRAGESIEFFLQSLAADGSCRATLIVRGLAR
jgi:hypothetical protein